MRGLMAKSVVLIDRYGKDWPNFSSLELPPPGLGFTFVRCFTLTPISSHAPHSWRFICSGLNVISLGSTCLPQPLCFASAVSTI